MDVGSIKPAGGLTGGQMAGAQPVDSVSKGIQSKILDAQRQMQELSSKEELSAEEKMKKRQELQQEISSLNTQLRRRQAEISSEQRRAAMADNAQAERDDEGDEKNTEAGIPHKEMRAIARTDSSMEQTRRQGMVVARIEGGIAILKGEISQNEILGMDGERKEAELEKQQEKALKATSSQFSALGEAHKAMREAAQDKRNSTEGKTGVKEKPFHQIEDMGFIGATNFTKQKNRAQQKFFPFLDIRG